MNINIDHELLSGHQNEVSRPKLFKLLKYTFITLILVLIFLSTLEIILKIVHSYKELLSQTTFNEHTLDDYNELKMRVLPEDHEEINGNPNSSITNTESNLNSSTTAVDNKNETNQTTVLDDFLASMNDRAFRGNWQSDKVIAQIGENLSGEFGIKFLKFQDAHNPQVYVLVMIFRILNGHFIDSWGMGQGSCRFDNITADNDSFTGNYSTTIDYGKMFERIEVSGKCYSNVVIRFERSHLERNYTQFAGDLESTCGLKLSFSVKVEDDYEDFWKVMAYSGIVLLMVFGHIAITVWTTHRLNSFQSYNTAVSYVTVGENIIWNAFGCLSHFYLAVNYDFYRYQFGLPSLLYFLSFAVFELKLLYLLWNYRNARYLNDIVFMRRKLVRFYFLFYITLFFSLFFVMKFYFDTRYIYFAISITWIPQILFNAIYNNKVSLPWLYILSTVINRMLLPFYFRGCPENFFQLPVDYKCIIISAIIMAATTFFMYSQILFGARWFLPQACSSPEDYNFYKSREEIKDMRNDCDSLDCVICLFSLFNNENFKYFSDDFISAGDNENTQKKIGRKCKMCLKTITYPLIEFHENNFNSKRKPYMMTPCKHFFHAACLESWFKHKKECPSCRQEINPDIEI